MKTTPITVRRYCYSQINWKSNGICILGDRGAGKTTRQISGVDHSYLAVDDIEVGLGKKVPLYLFGFLY
ncbi:MAG: hypothetical protein KDK64_07950 [Chlamydiia bacterium]|nr:hypothetical protein [Chlamydiia bacterium]